MKQIGSAQDPGLRAAIERIEQARAAGIHPARTTRPGVMACGRVTGSKPG
jgi:hypothetical protein